MEFKDFFKLSLKLIAIFYGIDAIYNIAGLMQYFALSYQYSYLSITWVLGSSTLIVLTYYIIFLKSDWLIRFLKIDQGFKGKTVNFGNLTSNELLKIALILFGFFMIVWGLPNFVTNLFYAFKHSAGPQFADNQSAIQHDYLEMTQSGIYMLLGYLMVSNYKSIARWFDK